MSSEVLDELGRLVGDDGAYFVGGCVRDVRLGLPVTDVDVVVPGDPATVARRLARETGGSPFALSEAHGAWRVVLDGRTLDITAQRGGDILADLGERDFTVNAMAIPVDGDGERASSTRSAASATWRRADCASSRTGSSPTTRSGCCASPGSRTSSGSRSTPTPSGWPAATPTWPTGPPARGSTPRCGAS